MVGTRFERRSSSVLVAILVRSVMSEYLLAFFRFI
jgi:hypothetical protein